VNYIYDPQPRIVLLAYKWDACIYLM